MSLQFLADGLVAGATIGLGAVGVTLTYSILRFANFAYGEFISWGCYLTLLLAGAIGAWAGASASPLGALSIGPNVLAAGLLGMALTGFLAIGLDALLFRRLRRHFSSITTVIASFGASMALRAALEALFSSRPVYFSQELQIAIRVGPFRITPDQVALLGLAVLLAGALQLLLTRTDAGRSMRAVSENPTLARIVGIDVAGVIRLTWFVGGALACASGVMLGLVVQIRPTMGSELLLPLFAAAILGGIGSVPGALLGGVIVGLAEAATVQLVGAEWRAGVAFVVLIVVLLLRPAGLFGQTA
jgi:branched-chain amino acid transport system permease protein